MDLRCYSHKSEKICLCFFPCMNLGENITWEEWHIKEPLTIYATDYDMLLPYFESVFPLADPTDGSIQDYFDVCSLNWIGKKDWYNIIEHIKKDIPTKESEKEILFFSLFIKWIKEQLAWAEIIVVDGNL